MKKVCALLLTLILTVQIIPGGVIFVSAEENETNGKIGEYLSWTLDETAQILTISGVGVMEDNPGGFVPSSWHDITSLIIEDGIASIGTYAFSECSCLVEVSLPISITEIHKGAFCGCSSLSKVKYYGSQIEWENVNVDYSLGKNDALLSADFEFNKAPDVNTVIFNDITIIKEASSVHVIDYVDFSEIEWDMYNYGACGTLCLTNGLSYEIQYGGCFVDDEYYSAVYTDTQSALTPWEVGKTYSVTAEIYGVKGKFNVTIAENPVESIEIAPVTIVEGTHIGTDGIWIDDNYIQFPIYCYDIAGYTVHYKDGNTEKITDWGPVVIYGQEYYISVLDDQSYTNRWGVGAHVAHADFCGLAETDFEVNITESPIKSVCVPDITMIEGVDSSVREIYDERGECVGEYDYYFIMPDRITIECSDGSTYTGAMWELQDMLGVNIQITDDQSPENQWEAGQHTAYIIVDGMSFEFNVIITDTPIQYVSVEKIKLIEGLDGYYNGDKFIYSIPDDVEFVVTLKDGTVISSESNAYGSTSILIGGKPYYLDFSDYYAEDHSDWKAGDTYQINARLCGKTCVVYVEIIENPYKSLEIEERGDLYLVFTKKDGTVEEQKAIRFDSRSVGDCGENGGILTTDKAQYSQAVFRFDSPDEMFEKGVGYYLKCTDNVCLQIGKLTSNTLERSNWLALQISHVGITFAIKNYHSYAKNTGREFNGFDGTVTKDNIFDVVTIAVNVCDYFGFGDIGEDGYPYGLFDAEDIKKDVELLFGIKDVDLTGYPGYDAEKPQKVRVLWVEGGGGPSARDIVLENGKWIIEYTEYSDEEMTVICDYVKAVLNKDAKIEKIAFSNDVSGFVPGDANGDGKVNITDATAILKDIAKWDVSIDRRAADVNGDEKVTLTDVTTLLKYLANWEGIVLGK